jgi:hypothetical protein
MKKLILFLFLSFCISLAFGQTGIFPRTTASGTNTYTASAPSGCTCSSYVDGGRYQVLFTNANTSTSVTLAIHTAGAKTVYNSAGQALRVGEIGALDEKVLIYSTSLNGFRIVGSAVDLQFVADAKIAQTITNGVISSAPSQDAVYDALALKSDRIREYGVACSDLTTALTTGTSKAYFRMPRGGTLTAVRASLLTAQSSGSILTIDINEGGTTVLSTKLTIDNSEKTSTTAATSYVISDATLADDAEITFDIDQSGTGGAGLIVWLYITF